MAAISMYSRRLNGIAVTVTPSAPKQIVRTGETERGVLRMLCSESDDAVKRPLQLAFGDAESALICFDGGGKQTTVVAR